MSFQGGKSYRISMFFLHFETFNFGAFIFTIEDGCLEDGIIIVEDVDAERARCEES